ncbi:hypothetical protein BaRGS_00015785, partial [Batillaria attramentaria]
MALAPISRVSFSAWSDETILEPVEVFAIRWLWPHHGETSPDFSVSTLTAAPSQHPAILRIQAQSACVSTSYHQPSQVLAVARVGARVRAHVASDEAPTGECYRQFGEFRQ